MKRIIYCVVFVLLTCMSVNAQNVESAVCMDMAMVTETQVAEAIADELVISQEVAAELARPTLLNHSMLANDDYMNDPAWQSAKTRRTVGIIMTSIGSAGAIGFGISAVVNANKEDFGGVFSGILSTGVAFCSAGAAIVGGIIWASGNSKMQKIRLASSGTGLAYTF